MKKQMKNELMFAAETEQARLQTLIDTEGAKKACNYRKTLTACINSQKVIRACSDRFWAETELYTAGRVVPMYNIGSVMEQALFFLDVRRCTGKSTKIGFDHAHRGKDVEYKACLSASSKNTPYSPTPRGKYKDVLLVNAVGVWYIPAEDARALVDKYGRFAHNADYSEYMPDEERDFCEKLTAKIFG